jgi:two-component system phosphate regulon sensor histidine kinase PhoR
MSRKLIWIITVLMGLAIAALIIVQAYWIRNAVMITENQFNQLMSRSMIDIAHKIEQREASKIITRQINPFTFDSGYLAIPPPPGVIPNITHNNENKTLSPLWPGSNDASVRANESQDAERQEKDRWLKSRREFIDRVIASMFLVPPEIENRINSVDLEEIIRNVLKETGIDMQFEYAVNRWDNELVIKSSAYNPAAEAEYYRVQLFPADIYAHSNFLTVYFPERKNFLFKSLGYLTILSLLLCLVIVVSFAITLFIIFRQKRLSEIRSDFVSNMTHELKTPISTISLASQMLGDKSIPAEIKNTGQISKIISEECRRLGNQIEKVLQSSVFEKGKLKLKFGEVDLHEIINNVCDNFSIQVKSRNGKITLSLNAEKYILQADQVHITNVLSNLLDNAIKYCTRNPEIRIETFNKGDFLQIKVSDNGIGINKNEQKRVFERFYRIPTGNVHTVKGFGLGLSYVKMIVDEHHGHVDVESEIYEGATFIVYLPLKEYGSKTKDKIVAGGG